MDDNMKGFSLTFLMFFIMFTLPFSNCFNQTSTFVESDVHNDASARSQAIWSGVVELSESYTIDVTDELVISPCTVVKMDPTVRLFVEGRLIVEGDTNCPVIFSQLTTGLHYGIQFNSTSSGRGSIIDNISIEDSVYGITIYGSNPVMHNVTIINPSRVGIDLFSGANPVIKDLYVDQAGRDVTYSDWRYGIGLSAGSGSTPIVERVTMTDLRIRGLNIWGSSGGIYHQITIDNVTAEGSSTISAGVWVEDSQPLITNVSVDKSDYGVLIRHIDDGGFTRAVVRNCTVSNSMYKGIYVDKADHTNYSNYETADFTNTIVRGTGGPGAKTAGIGYAAIEINATGAWFENTIVENSTTVGVRLYYVDSSTTFRNLKIINSGDAGQGPHEAGLSIRSSFFAPTFDDLEISGSVGPGVYSSSGGAMQGTNWFLHNNTKDGLFIDSATLIIDGLHLTDNGESGAHVFDSRYVTLSNLTSVGNGNLGVTDGEKAGLFFEKSNDIESNSGDIACNYCNVSYSAGSGIVGKDSVDLWLNHIQLENNNPAYDPLSIDNSGLTLGQQGGRINMHDVTITSERTGSESGPALRINQAAANIDLLIMPGNHSGIIWNADNNGNFPSSISRAQFSGTSCLILSDHSSLSGVQNTITPECTGSLVFQNSQVNWSGLDDLTSSTIFNLDSLSSLHLHRPSQLDLASAIIAPSAEIDIAWDISVWVENNNSNGVPNAPVQISFDQFESDVQENTTDIGFVKFLDYIGQRWTQTGPSSVSTVSVSCAYDGISNSSSIQLDSDKIVFCQLPLGNQPPFLYWDTPEDSSVFPSGSEIIFNASRSWDLDDDPLTWEWISSIDGTIGDESKFTVNEVGQSQVLSDGLHTITAKLCDDAGHCVQQSRAIELSNFAPVVFTKFTPGLNAFNELIVARTGTVKVNLTGTYDPEGDSLNCWISTSYGLVFPEQDTSPSSCPDVIEYTFPLQSSEGNPAPTQDTFIISVFADDGVNDPVERAFSTILYNEIPEPQFTISRADNFSENVVTLDGSMTVDPEGDNLEVEFYSSLDGTLQWSDQESGKVWQGYLSRGFHDIEMRVRDDRPEHVESNEVTSITISVYNSAPTAIIKEPKSSLSYDSSELILFSANGSGDFDSSCSTFNEIGYWHCSENEPSQGSEYLQVSWTSSLDGRLSSTNQEGLIYNSRLSNGQHIITLEIDDGINQPVVETTTVDVSKSAPVLSLATPNPITVYKSSEFIFWNAVDSMDYDGDNFTMTIRSDLLSEPILNEVETSETHISQLKAGIHQIEITLIDSDGMTRTEFLSITVEPSPPSVVILEPAEGQSFGGGEEITLQEESFDADYDITFREWEVSSKSTGEILYSLTGSMEKIILSPDEYIVKLTVRDSLFNTNVETRNIRVEFTDPVLDPNSLVINPSELTTGELTTLEVSIALSDPDGTTQEVYATLTHGIQVWNFVFEDSDGDGVWKAVLEVQPETSGRPSMKIIARDGVGDSATSSQVSKTILVNDPDSANTNVPLIIGGLGLIVVLVSVGVVVLRLRRNRFENEMIESWDVFRTPANESKAYPEVEGGAIESREEVVNETWSQLEEQEEGI